MLRCATLLHASHLSSPLLDSPQFIVPPHFPAATRFRATHPIATPLPSIHFIVFPPQRSAVLRCASPRISAPFHSTFSSPHREASLCVSRQRRAFPFIVFPFSIATLGCSPQRSAARVITSQFIATFHRPAAQLVAPPLATYQFNFPSLRSSHPRDTPQRSALHLISLFHRIALLRGSARHVSNHLFHAAPFNSRHLHATHRHAPPFNSTHRSPPRDSPLLASARFITPPFIVFYFPNAPHRGSHPFHSAHCLATLLNAPQHSSPQLIVFYGRSNN